MLFLWALNTDSQTRKPLGSGFVLDAGGHVLTTRQVAENRRFDEVLVASLSAKSQPPVEVDMSDIDCHGTQDFCFARIPAEEVALRGITEFYRLGCYLPGIGTRLTAAGFSAGDSTLAGVLMPEGKVIGHPKSGGALPTSLPLESGMSGGPVFDDAGVVIGLVKGGSGPFGDIQPLQRARGFLEDRGHECLATPRAGHDLETSPAIEVSQGDEVLAPRGGGQCLYPATVLSRDGDVVRLHYAFGKDGLASADLLMSVPGVAPERVSVADRVLVRLSPQAIWAPGEIREIREGRAMVALDPGTDCADLYERPYAWAVLAGQDWRLMEGGK